MTEQSPPEPPEDEQILTTARERPGQVDVEALVEVLDADEGQARNEALMALGRVADYDADMVVEYTDEFIESLNDGFPVAESSAAQVLSRIANEYPEEVRPAIPRLIEMLDQIPPLTGYRAGRTLAPLLAEFPEDFVSEADQLIDVVNDPQDASVPTEEDYERMDNEERAKTEDRLQSRAQQARADVARSFGIREIAANSLVEVSERAPEAVAPRIEDLTPALFTDPPIAQAATIDTIANIAQHDPDAVDPVVDDLIEVTQTQVNSIRAHAIQALGHAGATEAADPLRELAASDDPELTEELQDLAAETADFLEAQD
ncbi:hypothetical protein L593_05860 [Salinarchaeum sp. Harcht-Bsk1]|uniref:HEAT repeat domain-containing protein n=1 Tax=Salinarchaeum sp. Harcht-Bsk1 TaxID=1333523 RepID=UPI00034236C9|nr:HEAT repeat domain-containing protein [Salinarchaeum sp. Harcht-Bsk1]AGN01121.1 hypothetical protein L593_05860 [Salinarchaeum sp. Harcht-Bsk1]